MRVRPAWRVHNKCTADPTVQVVALLLRSSGKADSPLPGWPQEQDFAHMLNRCLPDTIRVLGWADVPQDFHARCDTGAHRIGGAQHY